MASSRDGGRGLDGNRGSHSEPRRMASVAAKAKKVDRHKKSSGKSNASKRRSRKEKNKKKNMQEEQSESMQLLREVPGREEVRASQDEWENRLS